MNDGLVDDRIKREVLNGLKNFVSNGGWRNGDLKERSGPMIYKTFFIYFHVYFVPFKKAGQSS